MKELSTEQKAKAYDKAIEKAKIWQEHLSDVNDKDYADELNYIFPELKELEDESIKKALIEMVHDTTGDELWVDYGIHKEDALNWLEKQGQVHCKPTDEEMKTLLQTEYEKGRADALAEKSWSEEDELHIRELESLVKQVWATAEHENDKDTIHKMSDLSFFLKTLKPQPKQEWSEEDETVLGNLIYALANDRIGNDRDEYVDWLKSLNPQSKQVLRDTFGYEDGRQFGKNEVLGNPEKYGLQRFAEWSKSDKEIIKEIDIIIHGTNSISDEVRKKLQDWLKSLRSQNGWKPSEEQMQHLRDVIHKVKYKNDTSVGGYSAYMPLVSLYLELKHIKEK